MSAALRLSAIALVFLAACSSADNSPIPVPFNGGLEAGPGPQGDASSASDTSPLDTATSDAGAIID